MTISGLGGDPEYEIRFAGWALDLDKSLKNIPDAQVNTLVGKLATKESIRKTFTELQSKVKAEDSLAVFLIGPGKLNLYSVPSKVPCPIKNTANESSAFTFD